MNVSFLEGFILLKGIWIMAKKDTYIAGQTLHNRVEFDEHGNQIITQRVIYEQREFVEGYTDVRLPKKHKFQNGGFITVFQDALFTILTQGGLGKAELQILLYVLSTAGIDGSIETNLDIISEVLGMKKPNVSKALKGLVQRNIVIRKDGNRYDRTPLPMELSFNYDQINYNLAYNGKTANFKRKKEEHPPLSLPGEQEGEWIDTRTGQSTIEMGGRVVQEALHLTFEEFEEDESNE